MALIQSKGFQDGDDFDDFDPVEFEVSWRLRADRSKKGVEIFTCLDRIPVGALLDAEAGRPNAARNIIAAALLDTDQELDKAGEPIPGTSSYERYETLIHDPAKQTPAAEIQVIVQGLYDEYTERQSPAGAARRPTGPSGPSAGRSSATGRSSRAARSRKASTSPRSQQIA